MDIDRDHRSNGVLASNASPNRTRSPNQSKQLRSPATDSFTSLQQPHFAVNTSNGTISSSPVQSSLNASIQSISTVQASPTPSDTSQFKFLDLNASNDTSRLMPNASKLQDDAADSVKIESDQTQPASTASRFATTRTEHYDSDRLTKAKLTYMYQAIDLKTHLYFGVDRELANLPESRRSNANANANVNDSESTAMKSVKGKSKLKAKAQASQPAHDDSITQQQQQQQQRHQSKRSKLSKSQSSTTTSDDDDDGEVHIGLGYGECSLGSFDALLHYMEHETPEPFRLSKDSSFLDIGSGYGKAVLHASVRSHVASSVGIEYAPKRHELACECRFLLESRYVPGLTDTKTHSAYTAEQTNLSAALSVCRFVEGDICAPQHVHLLNEATHIYAFDVVFHAETHRQLLPLIAASPKLVLFVTFKSPEQLNSYGYMTSFAFIHQMKVRTTGKQNFTAYFYYRAQHLRQTSRAKQTVKRQYLDTKSVSAMVAETRVAATNGRFIVSTDRKKIKDEKTRLKLYATALNKHRVACQTTARIADPTNYAGSDDDEKCDPSAVPPPQPKLEDIVLQQSKPRKRRRSNKTAFSSKSTKTHSSDAKPPFEMAEPTSPRSDVPVVELVPPHRRTMINELQQHIRIRHHTLTAMQPQSASTAASASPSSNGNQSTPSTRTASSNSPLPSASNHLPTLRSPPLPPLLQQPLTAASAVQPSSWSMMLESQTQPSQTQDKTNMQSPSAALSGTRCPNASQGQQANFLHKNA